MRRDGFVAGFCCALIVAAVALVGMFHRMTPPEPAPRVVIVERPVPPITNAVIRTTDARTPSELASRGAPAPVEGEYSGNVNTRKFHKSSCHYYSCNNCVARFSTRDEARAAGFVPCGTCDP